LFERIDDSVIEEQIQKLENRQQEMEETNDKPILKENISFEDFTKLDIRSATIIEAEKVEKTDKLLKLTLDLGFEKRTVVSGIAQDYQPENIIGQRVTLLANLAPRKIRGVESQGMILMAENNDGSLKFVEASDGAENGASIG
ncbi:MAG: methionine--tRNA ligase subunit beta, partial [Saprospiraceae bacterium]